MNLKNKRWNVFHNGKDVTYFSIPFVLLLRNVQKLSYSALYVLNTYREKGWYSKLYHILRDGIGEEFNCAEYVYRKELADRRSYVEYHDIFSSCNVVNLTIESTCDINQHAMHLVLLLCYLFMLYIVEFNKLYFMNFECCLMKSAVECVV